MDRIFLLKKETLYMFYFDDIILAKKLTLQWPFTMKFNLSTTDIRLSDTVKVLLWWYYISKETNNSMIFQHQT